MPPSFRRELLAASGLVLAGVLVACGHARSTNIDTGGFHVIYSVVNAPGSPLFALAEVRLDDASGSLVDLTGGDAVRCNDTPLGIVNKLPVPGELLVYGTYGAILPDASSAVFRFDRVGETHAHEVAIPAPLSPQLATSEARYDDKVEMIWALAPRATVRLVAESSDTGCVDEVTLESRLTDRGSLRIDTRQLFPPTLEGEEPVACTFTLSLTQTVSSPIGSPFHGGELRSIATGKATLSLR